MDFIAAEKNATAEGARGAEDNARLNGLIAAVGEIKMLVTQTDGLQAELDPIQQK